MHIILPRPSIFVVYVALSQCVIYLLFILLSILLLGEGWVNDRLLSPLYPLFVMGLGVTLPGILRNQTRLVRGVFWVVSAIFLLGIAAGMWMNVEHLRENG